MGINFGRGVAPVRSNITVDSPAGIYVSARGSLLLKPDSNSKGNGKRDSSGTVIILDDCDTHKTFVKNVASLKGQYEYHGSLENFELTKKTPAVAARRDF